MSDLEFLYDLYMFGMGVILLGIGVGVAIKAIIERVKR